MAYKFQLGSARLSGSTVFEQPLSTLQSFSAQSLSSSGGLQIGGDVRIDGASAVDVANTDQLYFRDADGTVKMDEAQDVRDLFFSAVSGDATVAAGGALTIAADAVESGMLNDNVISGQAELAHADILDADELMISDGGVLKKVGVDSLRDHFFGVVSGDATIADGGALTIGANAVEDSMVNDNVATGLAGLGLAASSGVLTLDIDEFSALGGATVAQGDHLLLSDDGTEKKVTFSNLEDSIFGNVSGDATIAAGGALTIAADAVEGSMLNDNVISGQDDIGAALATTDELLVSDGGTIKRTDLSRFSTMLAGTALQDSSGQLRVKVSGSMSRASGFVGLSGSIAGAGLSSTGNVNAIETLFLDIDGLGALGGATVAQADNFLVSDNGTEKKVTFSNLEDSIFGNVSGDATIAAGGALTIAAGAVEHGMLNDNIISGQDELAHADIADADELMISDAGTVKRVGVDSLRDHFFGVVSGDATVADGGALTIAAGAVEGSMLNANVPGLGLHLSGSKLHLSASVAGSGLDYAAGVLKVNIDEFDALGSAALHQTQDKFLFSDNGVEKTVTFSNLQDAVFAGVSGDATVAAGGALTIAAGAVEHGMLAEDIISGQDELAHADIADADELMISDAGTIKRVGVDSLRDHFFGVVSGDATVADGGALTIAANAVEDSMVNDNVATGLSGNGLSAASGVMTIDLDGANSGLNVVAGGVSVDLNILAPAGVDVSADSIAIIDANDGDATKKESIADLVGSIAGAGLAAAGGVLSIPNSGVSLQDFSGDFTASVGYNSPTNASMSGGITVTMPSPLAVAGAKVVIKAPSTCSDSNTVSITGATMDGQTTIVLEGPGAAVTLINVDVAGDSWIIV